MKKILFASAAILSLCATPALALDCQADGPPAGTVREGQIVTVSSNQCPSGRMMIRGGNMNKGIPRSCKCPR